ncbi:MAG: transcriptional regulator [Gammaproteobacteria bacterium]|nr:transcriptional regulator [Gammaproteobacteria bacterium]
MAGGAGGMTTEGGDMVKLVSEKLIRIIAAAELEAQLVELSKRRSVSGYTVVDARGAGASGIQPGLMDIDSNILFLMVVPPEQFDEVMEDLAKIMRRGHHMMVLVSDTEVMRRKNVSVDKPGV